MVKVRFHLARGENYQKWQVTQGKKVLYLDPESVCLLLVNCRLRNRRGTADKIFAGEDKTVCAWVECEAIAVTDAARAGRQLLYNPRRCPHWTSLETKANLDNAVFLLIVSRGRTLFEGKI